MNFKKIKKLAVDTFSGWLDDKAPKLAAALAYYTVFSLTPIILIGMGIASFIFKGDAARGQIAAQIAGLVGQEAAQAIQSMIGHAGEDGRGTIATVVGLLTSFFGASGVFGELQDSINTIWKVDAKKHAGVKAFIKDRFLSFSMVLGVGFLLTVSLVLSAVLAAMTKLLYGSDAIHGFFWANLNFLLSFGMSTLLFTLIFKVLPDVQLTWKDTWPGGLFTALLFTLGKTVLGFYLGRTSVASGYGAAGSLVIVLLWVYYSAQILFIGAEFTRVYTLSFGSKVKV